jgi:ubiquinone/menaquinone biosynthesis C-methylase UbiE
MIVLETGCGMGYFTLPLARMVGPEGKVIAVDIQQKMLSVLARRAKRAGLSDRIALRQNGGDGLDLEALSGEVDLAVALHMVHEVPDQTFFFNDVWQALKPGGEILVVEPKGHVSPNQFEQTIDTAKKIGFRPKDPPRKMGSREVLLTKPHI